MTTLGTATGVDWGKGEDRAVLLVDNEHPAALALEQAIRDGNVRRVEPTAIGAKDTKTGIAIRFLRSYTIDRMWEYCYTLFSCGYQAFSSDAAKRHRNCGCRQCKRDKRRHDAIKRRRAEGRRVY